MSTTPQAKLQDLLKDFGTAMLVTRSLDGHLRSRPMATAEVQEDGTVWFITSRESGKIDELNHDAHVNVAMQSSAKYVSISGTASVNADRQKIASLWREAWKVWFPKGKDDPELVLLRVQGECGEYWDNSGTQGIKYLFEAGKAYLTGTRPQVEGDVAIHAKVKL